MASNATVATRDRRLPRSRSSGRNLHSTAEVQHRLWIVLLQDECTAAMQRTERIRLDREPAVEAVQLFAAVHIQVVYPAKRAVGALDVEGVQPTP